LVEVGVRIVRARRSLAARRKAERLEARQAVQLAGVDSATRAWSHDEWLAIQLLALDEPTLTFSASVQ
ncbi:MAG TPA: hypothetical protein VKQ36_08310, partial [Ktedonobacterales bacterium]|nr:hypothetical protein [Ktedonobacterales bacterium]